MLERFRALRSRAPFWSLRTHEERREHLAVRQDTVEPPRFSLDRGAMLAAVVEDGTGYCATSDLSPAGLQAALDRATAWAEATRGRAARPADPAHLAAPRGEYQGPSSDLRLERRALLDLLADECRRAKRAKVVERVASLTLIDEERLYFTNTGGDLRQRWRYTLPHMRVTANEGAETQSRSLEHAQQGGLEQLAAAGFAGCGERLAEEALALLAAPQCPSGTMDLLLMPDQMMLQVHESIGHPLELDRILGDERNYAGTSFVTPEMIGSYRYGSELLDVTYDPTIPGELASYAYDDEGRVADRTFLIKNGILVAPLGGPGIANARASGWNRAPIHRMANLNVEPGSASLEDMVRSIERGVLMRTNLSWSIDDSRNKFQFGCEWGERIEDGERRGVVKNPNYRGISATFWRSLRAVGSPATFEVHGTLYCGKGEPNQAIHCGHASPACVFSGVEVLGGEAS